MLHQNPFARGAFLLYIIILHVWTFALLMYHAHSFDHHNFGNEHGVSGVLRGSVVATGNHSISSMLRGSIIPGENQP
jgi:hypothetical protein